MWNLVKKEDVQGACERLGLLDWSAVSEFTVTVEDARGILTEIGGEARDVGIESFRDGLQVELEHGTRFPDANITNNHPVLTGRIVLAHLKESLLYYKRIAVAELEGELLDVVKSGDSEKSRQLYGRVLTARLELNQGEASYLAN